VALAGSGVPASVRASSISPRCSYIPRWPSPSRRTSRARGRFSDSHNPCAGGARRSSLPYHSRTGQRTELRSMSHRPIQETLSQPAPLVPGVMPRASFRQTRRRIAGPATARCRGGTADPRRPAPPQGRRAREKAQPAARTRRRTLMPQRPDQPAATTPRRGRCHRARGARQEPAGTARRPRRSRRG